MIFGAYRLSISNRRPDILRCAIEAQSHNDGAFDNLGEVLYRAVWSKGRVICFRFLGNVPAVPYPVHI